MATTLRARLNRLYRADNRRGNVSPDPLGWVLDHPHRRDRQVAGLISACLAYGRVVQIGRSVGRALDLLGPTPHQEILSASGASLRRRTRGFRHRFTDEGDLAALLVGIKRVLERDGTLGACFARGGPTANSTVLEAATAFVREVGRGSSGGGFPLLPSPENGSACKRLHLYLRWMIRRDDVDPGSFDLDLTSRLLVPVDTHMHRIGRQLGFTVRRQVDVRTALEITAGFRSLVPEDPVRFDFVLARRGMRGQTVDFSHP